MKTVFILLTITFFSLNVVCNTNKSNSPIIEQHEQEGQLKLNNGKRWKANIETSNGVNGMIKLMESFTASKNPKDYNKLSKELRAEMNTIFDKCSMKGEAHDNLHAFLVPIFGYLKELNSDEIDTCNNGFNSMDKQLKLYKDYFE